MLKVSITIAIALGVGLTQLFLKGLSRSNRTNRKHGLSRDDCIFWTDWVILGGLGFVLSVFTAFHRKEVLPTATLVWGFITLVLACTALPFGLRIFAYGEDAQIKGVRWIVVADLLGAVVIAIAVKIGVQVYVWG